MTPWASWLAALGIPAVAVAGILALPAAPVTALPVSPPAVCDPTIRPIYRAYGTGITQTGEKFKLGSEAILELDACAPGVLTLKATGEAAGGSGPRLLVSTDDGELFRGIVTRPQAIAVQVPRAGRVYLSYLNDYIKQEGRTAYLTHLRLVGPCTGLSGAVSSSPDRPAKPFTDAFLSAANAITLRPCGSGELRFHASATEANGAFAVLNLPGATPDKVPLRAEGDYRVTLNGETRITISNPYYRLIENRNLILEDIQIK